MTRPLLAACLCLAVLAWTATRPADIPFEKHTLDLGANESCAIADINGDGRPDGPLRARAASAMSRGMVIEYFPVGSLMLFILPQVFLPGSGARSRRHESGHDVGQFGMQVRPDRREVLVTCSIRPPSRCRCH